MVCYHFVSCIHLLIERSSISGSISLPRLCPQLTKRLHGHSDQLVFVLVEETVHTVLLVAATVMTTVRRRVVRLASSDLSLLVSDGVHPESKGG